MTVTSRILPGDPSAALRRVIPTAPRTQTARQTQTTSVLPPLQRRASAHALRAHICLPHLLRPSLVRTHTRHQGRHPRADQSVAHSPTQTTLHITRSLQLLVPQACFPLQAKHRKSAWLRSTPPLAFSTSSLTRLATSCPRHAR